MIDACDDDDGFHAWYHQHYNECYTVSIGTVVVMLVLITWIYTALKWNCFSCFPCAGFQVSALPRTCDEPC